MSRDQRTPPADAANPTASAAAAAGSTPLTAPGTRHRNHCPTCLWSLHVDDDVPSHRDADCASSMEPIGVTVRDDGEWALVHRFAGCSTVHVNRIAGDDNPLVLMRLAVRPLAQPPFPLEWLTRV